MAIATLNDIGSKKLIEYVYVDTYTSRLSQPANNGTISTSVNKAVSFADHIVAGEVISANRNNQTADEFSLAGGGKSYQYQLGSVQLPSQVFTDTVHKAYLQMMKTFNKYRDDTDKSSVIYQNFGDTLQVKTCSFSKDQLLALAQMPINSSRSLRYEQNYDTAPAEARTVFVFLHYIKSLRCSLTDCTVNQ
jgi:PPE-repeat protein